MAVPEMSIENASEVCMPFGERKGWLLVRIAEKDPVLFCKLIRNRRKFYGDLRYALEAFFNSEVHHVARAKRTKLLKARKNQQLLDNAKL